MDYSRVATTNFDRSVPNCSSISRHCGCDQTSQAVRAKATGPSALPAHRFGLELPLRDHLNQPALEHLAACGQWEAFDRDEIFGHVVFGQAVRVEMRQQFRRRYRFIRTRYDGKTDALAQSFIRYRERGRFCDRPATHGEVLDPGRIDVVTAANDQILLAADDLEISGSVQPSQIAGHEPAMPIERAFRARLIAEIAEHQGRAPNAEFADVSLRHPFILVALAPKRDLHAFARASARRRNGVGGVIGP